MKTRSVISSITALVACLTVPSVQAGALFNDQFDKHSLAGWGTIGGKISIANSPVRSGNYAAKLTVNARRDKARTEMMPRSPKEFQFGKDYWIGFSDYLPSSWKPDSAIDVIFNLHSRPDRGENVDGAPLSLRIENNDWYLTVRSDGSRRTRGRSAERKSFRLGAIKKGQWTDWVFHIKPSYKKGGILEVWKEGKKVVTYKGPNCYNDAKGLYMKMGIYKPAWRTKVRSKVNERVLYVDQVKIAGSGSGYSAVAP